ncbi:MAG: RcnB family protein [Sphingomonas bacterium]|nr:RcnB family protein [Sphingomonas bacterium]
MRRLLLSVLLATSVAMPAMAQDRDFRDRDRGGQDASEPGDEARPAPRAERAESPQRDERPQRVERERPQVADWSAGGEARQQAVPQQSSVRHVDQSAGDHRGLHRDLREEHDGFHATDPNRREHKGFHREQKREHRSEHRDWNGDRDRGAHGEVHDDLRNEHGAIHATDPTSREHRGFHRDLSREHNGRHAEWSRGWRSNSSYDWRRYRGHNSSIFRSGSYYDPYGSSYRRFSIGFNLFSSYYQSNNWLNDPWMYRLPPADGPYRWVRYYDDALLVNVYTGQVVDVEYNFFW